MSERTSEVMSEAERTSKASSLEQVNECTREWTSEWPSTLCVYSVVTVQLALLGYVVDLSFAGAFMKKENH